MTRSGHSDAHARRYEEVPPSIQWAVGYPRLDLAVMSGVVNTTRFKLILKIGLILGERANHDTALVRNFPKKWGASHASFGDFVARIVGVWSRLR